MHLNTCVIVLTQLSIFLYLCALANACMPTHMPTCVHTLIYIKCKYISLDMHTEEMYQVRVIKIMIISMLRHTFKMAKKSLLLGFLYFSGFLYFMDTSLLIHSLFLLFNSPIFTTWLEQDIFLFLCCNVLGGFKSLRAFRAALSVVPSWSPLFMSIDFGGFNLE